MITLVMGRLSKDDMRRQLDLELGTSVAPTSIGTISDVTDKGGYVELTVSSGRGNLKKVHVPKGAYNDALNKLGDVTLEGRAVEDYDSIKGLKIL